MPETDADLKFSKTHLPTYFFEFPVIFLSSQTLFVFLCLLYSLNFVSRFREECNPTTIYLLTLFFQKPHHTHSSIKSGMKFNGGSGGEKSANFPIKERPMEEQKEPTWKEQDRQIWQSALSGHEESDKGGTRNLIFGAKLT